MPRGIAISTDTNVAAMASSSESGSRIKSSSMTGHPVQSELPKSNRMTPQSHVPNWTISGWSRPRRWRMSASCLASIWPPASPPKIRSATSPGMTRMITNTRAAAPSRVGTISRSRFARYVPMSRPPRSRLVLGQPDVLELLVRVVVGRRHVVLHLAPVHDVARPPETGHVVRVFEHGLLELEDDLAPLGRIERPRLAREQIVDARVAEAAPVLRIPGGIAPQEDVGVVTGLDGRRDDQLEVSGVPAVVEPCGGFLRPLLNLNPDFPPFLHREHAEVLVRQLHVAVLEDDLEAIGIARLGQELLGLRAVFLHVRAEPRQLVEIGLRQGELGARTQEAAHVLEPGEIEQHP